jgi:hypothetical protein
MLLLKDMRYKIQAAPTPEQELLLSNRWHGVWNRAARH